MALLVNMEGNKGALVCRDKVEDVDKKLKAIEIKKLGDATLQTYITLTGWHGKKVIIMEPFKNIVSIVEEDDTVVDKQQKLSQAKRDIQEKKQREQIQAEGGKVELINMFPNKKKTH